jgi:hypothetical protein
MEPKELISLVIALLMGVLTAYFAKSRGKSTLLWFFIGMFFGLFGFIALFFFPAVKPLPPSKETPSALPPESEAPKRENRFINLSWFYADMQHAQQGPVSFDELQRLWKEQKITENTYIWTQGMKEWKTISEEAELRHTLSA